MEKFGEGWSVDTLEKSRKLFTLYSKSATLLRKFENKEIVHSVDPIHKFTLSWNH